MKINRATKIVLNVFKYREKILQNVYENAISFFEYKYRLLCNVTVLNYKSSNYEICSHSTTNKMHRFAIYLFL